MIRRLLLLCVISAFSYAEVTIKEITSKPTSRAKDFLIWQYLKQDITAKQADAAYAMSTKKNSKLTRLYKKNTKDPYIVYKKACQKNKDLFAIYDKKCFKLALDPYKTLAMSNKERNRLAKKVESKNFIKILKIQNEPYSMEAYRGYPADTILRMFINTTASHRNKNLNINLDKEFLNYLSRSKKIHYFIKMVTRNKSLNKLQKSILLLDSPKLNHEDNFLLALHHLNFNDRKGCVKHLEKAYLKSKKPMDFDKINFWLYLVSKDTKYLDKLLLSESINMYTLYSHEKKNSNIENYFYTLAIDNSKKSVDIQNPFQWDELLAKIKETPSEKLLDLAQKYESESMLPVQSYIIEKASDFKMHGYIMPYQKYLQNVSVDDKALIYAIMRQESNFIPAALSRSVALGLMQMMPFLVDAMSKDMKLKTEYSDMFKPEVNIKYAIRHLEWMKKSLYHPLFMAYAYNGGMGFLRKHLKTGTFSTQRYEPFLSMELMSNSESREYGKKVLANYVMYKKILGEDVSIIHLFQILKDPKKTDRFRAQI